MHFERRHESLLPRRVFFFRFARHAGVSMAILGIALGIGIVGYHAFAKLSWLDSLLNSSMLLGGMGPVSELHTAPAKWFASFYALFSGLVFISVASVLLAPIVHRFLHRFHLEDPDDARSGD
jgi:hypothetical protein